MWFGVLLSDEAHHACVSTNSAGQVDGFVFARAMDAPPVYDPGGRTCLVDDFVWPNREVAQSLIDHVRTWATARGCSQLVIITPAADRDRKTLLDSIGLHPTSEWWTGPA